MSDLCSKLMGENEIYSCKFLNNKKGLDLIMILIWSLLIFTVEACRRIRFPLPLKFYKVAAYQTMAQRRYDESERLFEYIVKKYPGYKVGYEGLIHVAHKKQNFESIPELVKRALSRFPKEPFFVEYLLKAFIAEGDFTNIKDIVEKYEEQLEHNLEWGIIQAKFWKDQYIFDKSNKVLTKVLDHHPKDKRVLAMQASNFWFLGKPNETQIILEKLIPLLDFKETYVPNEVVNVYTAILLNKKEPAKLFHFYKKALKANPLLWEAVEGAIKLLVSQNQFDEATKLVSDHIKNHGKSYALYKFAFLFFELEKIENLRQLALQKDNRESLIINNSPGGFVEKLKIHLEQHPHFENRSGYASELYTHIQELSSSPKTLLNTHLNPNELDSIYWVISSNIQNRTPFSLIRLGDGEGHFLPYHSNLSHFQQSDRQASQKIWWNNGFISEEVWDKDIKNNYYEAITEADILGIPCPWRISKTVLDKTELNLNSAARGVMAIFNFLKIHTPQHYLISCHIHTHFEEFGYWEKILEPLDSCSLISCHPKLKEILDEKFGLKVRSQFVLPAEYKYNRLFNYEESSENHFPNIYNHIQKTLNVAYQGEVFLVGAGFLGKIYCHTIKKRGGIAIDIGSAADYWMGHQTRPYKNINELKQTGKFV